MPQAELITRIRHAPKRAPCPTCGRRGRRKRVLRRRLRTLAYRRVAWLEVTYAEYQARCRCRTDFRTWPLDVPPKADHAAVRQADSQTLRVARWRYSWLRYDPKYREVRELVEAPEL